MNSLAGVRQYHGFDLHFPASNVEHFFLYLFAIYMSFDKCQLRSIAQFLVGLFGLFCY
jgi:hypothetical protein